jgi:hypothetical protein
MKGKKGKVYYETTCLVHGKNKSSDGPWKPKQVNVGMPLTKKMKYTGSCPECRTASEKQ